MVLEKRHLIPRSYRGDLKKAIRGEGIYIYDQDGKEYSGPPVKDQKGVKKSLGQGSRNEALFIHAARGYLSR